MTRTEDARNWDDPPIGDRPTRAPERRDGGAATRAGSVDAVASVVDLGEVVAGLMTSPEWATEPRSSCSILHTPRMRVVLTALHAGADLHNDDPDEAVTIQGIRGSALVAVHGNGAVIDEGTLLAVPAGMPWRVVSTTDAVLMLTIARPFGASPVAN